MEQRTIFSAPTNLSVAQTPVAMRLRAAGTREHARAAHGESDERARHESARGKKHTNGTAYKHETVHRHGAWSQGSQR